MEINEPLEINCRKFSSKDEDYLIKNSDSEIKTNSNSFNFISNINNQNLISREIDEENLSIKTNSTGDMTPTRSHSMSQDLIEQFLFNENFINVNSANDIALNNNGVNQLNKIKVIEYLQKEKEILEAKNKITYPNKMTFKVMKTNMYLLQFNIEKYFSLPIKAKEKERKLKINDYYNDKICKEP